MGHQGDEPRHRQNQSAQSEEEGLEPTKEWVKDLIDEIVAEEFASPDLELHWLDEDEGDPETVLEGRLKSARLTLNEMRDALGLDPFDNAAADHPMVLTATGYVPIEANAGAGASELGANGRRAKAETGPRKWRSEGEYRRSRSSRLASRHSWRPRWPVSTKDGDAASEGESISPVASSEVAHDAPEPPERYAARDIGTRIHSTEGRSSANRAPRVQIAGPVPPESVRASADGRFANR